MFVCIEITLFNRKRRTYIEENLNFVNGQFWSDIAVSKVNWDRFLFGRTGNVDKFVIIIHEIR